MTRSKFAPALLFLLAAACGSSFQDGVFDTTPDAAETSTDTGLEIDAAAGEDAGFESSPDVAEDASTCVLPPQTIGDCVVAVCDGDAPILVNDPTDTPPDDGNLCTDDLCAIGGPYGLLQAAHPNKLSGTPCGEGKTCNGNGTCS